MTTPCPNPNGNANSHLMKIGWSFRGRHLQLSAVVLHSMAAQVQYTPEVKATVTNIANADHDPHIPKKIIVISSAPEPHI
mmetsp:Transcript_96363/g.150662  ORF Transcript_96363/g.150662 Transcript_96363/m.150662 type:complete len:80 (+) Transcript_96363:162-401(+)